LFILLLILSLKKEINKRTNSLEHLPQDPFKQAKELAPKEKI
jgi:hypothetical protein